MRAGLALAVVGAAALAVVLRSPGREETDAESVLTYPLDAPVRFALEPQERAVRLTTWLVRPDDGWTADARYEERWCLDLALDDAAGTRLRTWRTWVSSQTSLQEEDDGVLRPRAWTDEPALVTLDRPVRVEVPSEAAAGGTLTVRAGCTAPGARVLAMAQRAGERSRSARLRLGRSIDAARREALAASVGVHGWRDLPGAWRDALLGDVWERLGALRPAGGGVAETVRLYARAGQATLAEASAEGLLVPPGGAVAWNVRGPATFEAAWALPDGKTAPPTGATAHVVHEDGRVEDLPVSPGTRLGPWAFPEGVASIQVFLDPAASARRVRAWATGAGADPAWGDPPRTRLDGARFRVGPDLRGIEMARVTGAPVRFEAAPGELLRLHVRVPLPTTVLTGGSRMEDPVHVVVTARDADGRAVAEWQRGIQPVASPFERYALGDSPATAAVGEATAWYFLPPAHTAHVEVSASAIVDVAVRVAHTSAPLPHEGYELPEDAGARARFSPAGDEAWVARAPEAYEALATEGRIVRVEGQVRLEPRVLLGEDGAPAEEDEQPWYDRPLAGAYDLLAAPDPDGGGARGAYVRLGAAPARVTVPKSGELVVAHRVPAERVGAPVTVVVGGVPHTRTLLTAGDTFRLEGLAPGPTSVRLAAPGLFLAKGVGGPAWRVKKVWPTRPGDTWSIPAHSGPSAIAVHAWLPAGAEAVLAWRVVGAPPPSGLHDVLTRREGRTRLVAAADRPVASPLSFAGGELRPTEPVTVRLHRDLGDSPRVELWLEGDFPRAWLRTYATWPAEAAPARVRHWRRGPA